MRNPATARGLAFRYPAAMAADLFPLRVLLLTLTGWAHREHQRTIACLVEENRVLCEQLGKRRLRLTDDQRRRLAAKGKLLSRKLTVDLGDVLPRKGSRLDYVYDYGDDWLHRITVEAIEESSERATPHALRRRKPRVVTCLGAARAAPPENCGGPPGYQPVEKVLRHAPCVT